MENLASDLEAIAQKIQSSLSVKYAAREKALPLTRDVIRNCANSIRAVHRGEYEAARALLQRARSLVIEIEETLAAHPELLHAGFVHDAQKEYAEASITLAVIAGEALPGPDELGVRYPAYLNGMGEAVGELRRHVLDTMRQGKVAPCEQVLRVMDDLYGVLVTIDFPDALTGGLRRTTDMVRGVLERTRGDLTMALRQQDLEQRLDSIKQRLDSGS